MHETDSPTSRSLSLGYGKRMMLFGGRAHPVLAKAICKRLEIDVGAISLVTFPSSEVYCRFEESVRGADVFLVQPICANPAAEISANDALMELLLMIDAAVGASAHRVIAVCPWFGYSRQDRKGAPREPISARVVARLLESAGVDRVLTMDLHTGQLQGFFEVPVDHMTAIMRLAEHVVSLRLGEGLVVVAPDAGRAKLSKKFADRLGADYAILETEPAEESSAGHGQAEVTGVVGEVAGRPAVILDDIIDTGGTLRAAGEAVSGAGATRVFAAATHGIFSGDAYENLRAAKFEGIVVTDTIPHKPGAPENLTVLPCDPILGDSISRIFTDDSVSAVFEGQNQVF